MFQSKSEMPVIEFNEKSAPSVIGKDLTIVGNAYSAGQVHVSGVFQGDIQCASVIVGEMATVTGNLEADEIVVSGNVTGTLKGKRVKLQAYSRIEGDIYHESLAIEEGAVFAGKSYQDEKATGLNPKLVKPAAAAQPNGTAAKNQAAA
ncbi:MAG: polymer-forming cytoskeletal protein [Pseudomonadota bacterium]